MSNVNLFQVSSNSLSGKMPNLTANESIIFSGNKFHKIYMFFLYVHYTRVMGLGYRLLSLAHIKSGSYFVWVTNSS